MNMRNLLLGVILLISVSLSAKSIYVSKDGADTNGGTLESPYLTIARASAMLSAGDTCFIMEGRYNEVLQTQASGTSTSPIVYTAYQDDEVLISATEKLTGWQVHSGDIYKATYTMTLGRQNMIFADGKVMDWARWPNNEDNDPYTIDAYDVVNGGSGSTIITSRFPTHDWTGGYVWYLGAHSGTSWTREIKSTTSTVITFEEVDITKWPFDPHNPTVYRNENRGRYVLKGVMDALDYEREWYYEAGTVYFQAPGNVDPNTLDIEVGVRSATINIKNNYVHVIGLKAFGGNVQVGGEHSLLSHCEIIHGMQTLDEFDNSSAQTGDAAVYVSASYATVDHNTVKGSSLNGIIVQGWGGITDVVISNNHVSECNTVGIHASPIRSSATKCTFWGNTIHTTGRDGMYSSGTNCEIAYNDIYDCMRINNDGGVFYTVGNTSDKNTTIHHNWFRDSEGPDYADGRCAGIYLDNNSKGYLVHHNVVYNVTWAGIQINWDNWNIDFFNNSIYQVESAMGRWENGYTLKDVVLKNNYGNVGEFIGTDISTTTNIINMRTPFVSAEDLDFRPYESSYIVDEGEVIAGFTGDYIGANPDIGAYEYGLSPWEPGVDPVMGGDDITAIDDVTESLISIYPNPLQGQVLSVNIPSDLNGETLMIFDLQGRQVYSYELATNTVSISREVFPSSGLYLIKINAFTKTLIVD